MAGTSYSGQYWGNVGPHRGDFPWVLQLHLDNVEVQNRARAGRGSFHKEGSLSYIVGRTNFDPFYVQMALIPFIVIFNFATAKIWSLKQVDGF